MATAHAKAFTVINTEIIEGVVLELTMAEAEALLHVTRHIGGDPHTSARGRFDAIRAALRKAGVEHRSFDAGSNSILYKN